MLGNCRILSENIFDMDDCPTVLLHCPAHHELLTNGLWHFLTTKNGVDFDFGQGGCSVRAHRLVVEVFLTPGRLAAAVSSPVETVSVTTETEVADDQTGNLDSVLEFLYKGSVEVPEDRLDSLLAVAKELDFQILIEAVENNRKCPLRGRRSHRQRKGNPVKILQYMDASSDAANSDEDWETPSPVPKKKIRKTKTSSKKVSITVEPQPPNEELNICHDNDSSKNAADVPAPKRQAKTATKSGKLTVGRKAGVAKTEKGVRRSVGRPRTSTDPPIWRKCQHCNYETFSEQRFQVHLGKHDASIKVVKCPVCDKKFAGDEALRLHLCVVKSKHHCPHCDYRTHDVVRYHVHLAKHDPGGAAPIFSCDTCRRPFLSQQALDRHKAAQHANGPVTFKCAHCDFQTLKRITFHSHMFASHDLDMYGAPILKRHKCDECEFVCARPSQLKRHQTEKHSTDKPYKCRLCSYCSVRNSDVYNHNRNVHLGIKKYMCDQCGFRSTSNHGLDRHRRTHTGERPYICEVCGKAYGDPATLKWHSQCHESGDRPFVCHICGHSSSRQQYLKAHLRTHKSQEKPKI